MGFLGKLFGKKENDTIENTVTQQITTEKDLQNQNDEEPNSPMMPIDMSKHQENLNTVLINMSKDNKIDMTKHVARVALAMDYSGSMSNLFRNGSVQETATTEIYTLSLHDALPIFFDLMIMVNLRVGYFLTEVKDLQLLQKTIIQHM